MTSGKREQRLVFGEVAELYDQVRPGYPEAVFDRILAYGDLVPGDRVLEVGCGTGKASAPMARRGLRLTALEPDPAMARVARRQTDALPGKVEVEQLGFEDWLPRGGPFAALLSAQAWHWVDPETRLARAHAVLRSGGTLALMWNVFQIGSWPPELRRAVNAAYRRSAPGLLRQTVSEIEVDRREEIRQSGLFQDLRKEEFPWSRGYERADYLRLLETQSDHRLLPGPIRRRLLQAIEQALIRQGGLVPQGYRTFLYLARSAPGGSGIRAFALPGGPGAAIGRRDNGPDAG